MMKLHTFGMWRGVAQPTLVTLAFIRNHRQCGFANAMAGGDRAPPRFNRIGTEI